jgi:hypothetical protein
MHETDRLRLLAELDTDFCELNHGPDTSQENFPASDYIVTPFGYSENEIEEVAARELVVPVCHECTQALLGDEWTLLYCFECCSNQWIYRNFAQNKYRHHILWLKGCPHCAKEFGGLYFNDLEAVTDTATLLLQRAGMIAA